MTSRERWTVYPLLLLAIGLAVRAAGIAEPHLVTDTLTAAQIRCRELLVETEDGTVLIHMGRVVDGGGGRIEIKNATGNDAIAIGTRPGGGSGRIEYFDTTGQPVAGSAAADRQKSETEYARRDSNPQPSVPKFEVGRFRNSQRNHEIDR